MKLIFVDINWLDSNNKVATGTLLLSFYFSKGFGSVAEGHLPRL